MTCYRLCVTRSSNLIRNTTQLPCAAVGCWLLAPGPEQRHRALQDAVACRLESLMFCSHRQSQSLTVARTVLEKSGRKPKYLLAQRYSSPCVMSRRRAWYRFRARDVHQPGSNLRNHGVWFVRQLGFSQRLLRSAMRLKCPWR